MDTLSNYCMEWKLHVNLEKKVMVCSTRKPKICYGFYYNNSIVEITNRYKYLCIILQSNGSLKHPCDDLAARPRKAYFALKRKLPFDSNRSPNLWLKLYNSIIVPILTYSSEMWISDFKTNPNNFILRNILGVHNKASHLATKLELFMSKYINSLLHMILRKLVPVIKRIKLVL